jgi:hypothetical protein
MAEAPRSVIAPTERAPRLKGPSEDAALSSGRGQVRAPVHAGGLFFGFGHSTSRITLRRFIRSSACTTSFVEYGQESSTVRVSSRGPGLNVFPQDAPSVLNGANKCILVGIIHGGTQFHMRKFKPGKADSFRRRAVAVSSIPRQLPPSAMVILTRRIERAQRIGSTPS